MVTLSHRKSLIHSFF